LNKLKQRCLWLNPGRHEAGYEQAMSIHELYLLFSMEATHICWESTFAKLWIELQCLLSS